MTYLIFVAAENTIFLIVIYNVKKRFSEGENLIDENL